MDARVERAVEEEGLLVVVKSELSLLFVLAFRPRTFTPVGLLLFSLGDKDGAGAGLGVGFGEGLTESELAGLGCGLLKGRF